MKSISVLLSVLLLVACQNDDTDVACPCGATNQNRFVTNTITNEKSIFITSGYTYHFCSTQSGDLFSGFEKNEIKECSSLLKEVGFDFNVKSDPIASFTENALGADLYVIVVDDENKVQELIHPSNSTWSNSPISGSIQAKSSIASYWSTSLRYHYVYFIGADGGLYSIFKDASNGTWTNPNNLLPLVGVNNSAVEISSARIVMGTAGDDLYISIKTSDNLEIKLAHLSTEQWKVL